MWIQSKRHRRSDYRRRPRDPGPSVLRVIAKAGKLVVEGVNRVYKHVRKSQRNPQGGRLSKEMPIPLSNVALVCQVVQAGDPRRRPLPARRRQGALLQEVRRRQRRDRSGQGATPRARDRDAMSERTEQPPPAGRTGRPGRRRRPKPRQQAAEKAAQGREEAQGGKSRRRAKNSPRARKPPRAKSGPRVKRAGQGREAGQGRKGRKGRPRAKKARRAAKAKQPRSRFPLPASRSGTRRRSCRGWPSSSAAATGCRCRGCKRSSSTWAWARRPRRRSTSKRPSRR